MGRKLATPSTNHGGSHGGRSGRMEGKGNGNGLHKGRPVDVSRLSTPALGTTTRPARAVITTAVAPTPPLGLIVPHNHPDDAMKKGEGQSVDSRVTSSSSFVDTREKRVRHDHDLVYEKKRHFCPGDEMGSEALDYFNHSMRSGGSRCGGGGGAGGLGGLAPSSSHSSLTTNPENNGSQRISNTELLLRNGMMRMKAQDPPDHHPALGAIPRNNGMDCLPSHLSHGGGEEQQQQTSQAQEQPASSSHTRVSCDRSQHISVVVTSSSSSTHAHGDREVEVDGDGRLSDVDMGMNTSNTSMTRVSVSTLISRQVTVDSLVSPLLRRDYDHSSDRHNPSSAVSSGHGHGGVVNSRPLGYLPSRNSFDSLASDVSIHSNISRQAQVSQHKSQVASGLYENIHPSSNSILLMMTGPLTKDKDTTMPSTMTSAPTVPPPSSIQSVQSVPIHSQSVPRLLVQPVPVRPQSVPLPSAPSMVVTPKVPIALAKSFQSPRSKRSTFIEAI